MNTFRLIFIVLAILSIGFSACTGQAQHFIPAVVENGGGLVEIKVQSMPGNGDVFITTYPHTGISTQESIDNAVYYASTKTTANVENCDVLASINGKTAEYVDGPSAGVAFSVLAYAAFNNEEIRKDTTVTGAVDKDGVVGRVGGLYEKALAASRNNVKYLLTPPQSVHERILLSQVKKTYGLQVYEIENADDAINFMVHGETPAELPLPQIETEFEDLPASSNPSIELFKGVTNKLIDLERNAVQAIPTDEEGIGDIKNLFLEEIKRQETLVRKGYQFTAANEAFLNYIAASTAANAANPMTVDLGRKVQEIRTCIAALPATQKTEANFEWIMGADMRKVWAEQRLSEVDIRDAQLAEEKYAAYNELMYADAWCFISKTLHEESGTGSNGLDEGTLRPIAEEKLLEAQERNISNSEWLNHYETAQMLFNDGKYGAAALDASFAISMDQTDKDLAQKSIGALEDEITRLKGEEHASAWGQIYQTQGIFLDYSGDKPSAYRLLKLSEELESTVGKLQSTGKFDTMPMQEKTLPERTVDRITDITSNGGLGLDAVQCLPGFVFVLVTFAALMLGKRS